MDLLKLAFQLLASTVPCALAATLSAQDHTLSNGTVDLKFKQEGTTVGHSNLWLTSIESLGQQTIALEQGLPLWNVETRIDPSPGSYDLDIVPTDLALVVRKTVAGGVHSLTATWGPGTVAAPSGSPSAGPQVKVVATWTLKAGEDMASTTISVQILNPTATDYRLWLTRYPRVAVSCLDADLDGSDRLAMGRNGGQLYGDPIHYVDPNSGQHLKLTQDPEHTTLLASADSLEPGTLGIPASSYYDSESGLGLYCANDDDEGYVKGVYWTQEPTLGTNGSLLFQTVQFATGNIYTATSYASPYKVQLAALDRGDWIGAAQRYRSTWRSFGFYPGPIGSSGNQLVTQDLKDIPIALWLNSGNGYCITGPTGTFDQSQAQGDLDDLAAFMGTPFPFVYLNRYGVDCPHEIFLGGYSQAPAMQDVRDLIAYAEGAGHRTVIHTMTEKSFVTSTSHSHCSDFAACSYCSFEDTGLMGMYLENALVKSPTANPGPAPCSRGAGTSSGVDWPAWFATLNAEFSNGLGSTGGLGWTSPNPTAGWCFSQTHDHEPGFGNFLAQGWLEMLESTAGQVTSIGQFARTMETSVAFFSQAAGVQNTWNFDLGRDFNHFAGVPGSVASYHVYEDAPIWRIPMMQMATDNAMYASVYSPPTLRYPYAQPYSPASLAIFDEFPAVTGALACWSMAERVLSYQSVVYLNNADMVPLADVDLPGPNPAKYAASDMYKYYRGLARFLTGVAPVSLIDYHVGSLERPPAVALDNVTETFVLSADTIEDHFDTFEALMSAAQIPLQDLDWSKYQPFKHLVGQNDGLPGTIWLPAEPEAEPTYLPHGMYRHPDGQSLAFLLTNPWGVRHHLQGACIPGQPCVTKPMNPFTFDYGSPSTSSANTYDYRFTFDPADYAGFPNQYEAAVAVYDVNGQVVSQTSFQSHSGATELTGTLAPSQYAGWVFRP